MTTLDSNSAVQDKNQASPSTGIRRRTRGEALLSYAQLCLKQASAKASHCLASRPAMGGERLEVSFISPALIKPQVLAEFLREEVVQYPSTVKPTNLRRTCERTRMKQPGIERGVTEKWMTRCSALVLQGNQGGDLGGAREIYMSSTNPRLEHSRVVYPGCPWKTTRLSKIKDVLESILIPNPARSRHFGVGSYTCLF